MDEESSIDNEELNSFRYDLESLESNGSDLESIESNELYSWKNLNRESNRMDDQSTVIL